MTAPLLASRVMKARWREAYLPCVLCGVIVRIGNQVGLLPTGWAHTSCIIGNNMASDGQMHD